MTEVDSGESRGPTVPAARPRQTLVRGTAVGRYLLLDLLGEGGMGTVYAAYDPELGRKVAIKLLKMSGEAPEAARARLLHEAQAMARLTHAHVLAVYDAGRFGDELFMAMELVEGETLTAWLRQRRRRRAEILRVFLAAGEGLAAAHAAGLVHRDFKPDNVLVGTDGRVRVTDFGLTHLKTTPPTSSPVSNPRIDLFASAVGSITGTPAYMAPEQLQGQATDARTDQFSLCVALWQALTGRLPFGQGDFQAIRAAVLANKILEP